MGQGKDLTAGEMATSEHDGASHESKGAPLIAHRPISSLILTLVMCDALARMSPSPLSSADA